jgi:hypothetical protein
MCKELLATYLAWLTVPRTVLESLPRFERYTALDYDDPSGLVLKTLKQVYESVIYEDVEINGETMRRPVQSLRDLKTQVESRIHDKVQELMDHIRRYNPSVAEIS